MKVNLAAVAAIATLLCGHEAHGYELKKTSTGELVRFAEHTITLRLSEDFGERFGVEESLAAANGAAEAWAGIPGVPEIRIVTGSVPRFDEQDLVNSIHLLDDSERSSEELALTYTSSTTDGYVVAADIVVNGHKPFSARGSRHNSFRGGTEHFDLQAVLTHEMGHLLGLAENELDEEATMHPDIGPGETFQCTISEDDREGAMAVYQEEVPSYAGCSVDYRPGRSGPLFLLLLAGGLAAARSRSCAEGRPRSRRTNDGGR